MTDYLKLLRWKNLLIIAFTLLIMRYLVLIPVFRYYGVEVLYSDVGFLFLCLATIFIAAGGNLINDYFDRKADSINRPKKVVVGFTVKRRNVIAGHLILSILGVFFGFFASYFAGSLKYGLFFILMVYILWKYSSGLKRTFFWGNFFVALLIAIVPFSVGISEYLTIKNYSGEISGDYETAIRISIRILAGFACFAFIFNFIREVVKDVEDIEGDKKTGVRSIAVVAGVKKTNFLVFTLSLIAVAATIVVWHGYVAKLAFFENHTFGTVYVWTLIIIPSFYVSLKILASSKKRHYTKISKLLKIIMVFGVLFSFVISFMIHGTY